MGIEYTIVRGEAYTDHSILGVEEQVKEQDRKSGTDSEVRY